MLKLKSSSHIKGQKSLKLKTKHSEEKLQAYFALA
jgi:hypothetical protein